MATSVMKQKSPDSDRPVRDIIASARSVRTQSTSRVSVKGALGMSLLSGLLFWLSFTPVDASPLAWIAPIPLLLMVRIEQRTHRMYSAIYAGGLINQLATLQWMRLGDPTMYFAWVALAVYLAFYAVAFTALTRIAVHRWSVPLVLAAPLVWTGMEYFKAHMLTGFAWYLLGHTQYRWLELIQISDVVGAYGVSFIVMMSAAALSLMVPHSWLIRLGLALPSTGPTTASGMTLSQLIQVAVTLALFGSTLGYGYVRRAQADFKPGPRVALIQGNFIASLRAAPISQEDIYFTHMRLNARAVREQPQIIIWPESMFPWPLLSADKDLDEKALRELMPSVNPQVWKNKKVHEALVEESQRSGSALIYGVESASVSRDGLHRHNSAVFVRPTDGIAGQYNKIHLVPFGEYIPLMKVLPFMRMFSPYREAGGLDAGSAPALFEFGQWRLAPIICFEDTVPHLVRDIVAAGSDKEQGKQVDVLVNMTNDGWFHGSSELDQHLITAAFRAVECRTPLVRAVNTGISAVIDGDGAICEPDRYIDGDAKRADDPTAKKSSRDPKTGAWHKQVCAAVVHNVPLDSRRSLYVRHGDWFAMFCAACGLFVAFSTLIPKRVLA